MERLTRKSMTGTSRYVSAIGSGHGAWPRIIQRLAAYEDTGLEPEEIAPVVHGQWTGEGDGYADGEIVLDVWYCSECNYCIDDGTDDPEALPNYCPNCGAKMKKEADHAE